MLIESETKSVEVSSGTKQTGETQAMDWVERSVWTDRMLEALEQGVRGGVWFSLIDMNHFRWPNKFFQELGVFSLEDAHTLLFQSSWR
jgi:hypothetical protein